MKHGSLSYYVKYKCRCEPCKKSSREYMRKYRQKNPAYRLAAAKKKREYFDKVKKFIRKQKEKEPCFDCGVKYPYFVMHFDHLPQFTKTVELSNASSIVQAKEEIKKCELVCANCHAHRTQSRLTLQERSVKI